MIILCCAELVKWCERGRTSMGIAWWMSDEVGGAVPEEEDGEIPPPPPSEDGGGREDLFPSRGTWGE